MSEEWHGLHPASIAVNLVPQAWRVLKSTWPFLVALVYGHGSDSALLFDVGLVLLFSVGTVATTILHWFTLGYRVHAGRLEIRTGLFNKQTRVIDPERIQNVSLVRNVFQRVAGLVEVRIETASGREVEGMLSALTEEDASALVAALEAARRAVPAPTSADGEVIVATSVVDLLRAGLTSPSVGSMFVTTGVVMQGLTWFDDGAVGKLGRVEIGLIGVVAALGAWWFGIVTTILRHYGFRLVRGRTLVAEEGLFTHRRVELRANKVQRVEVTETVLQRWAGIATVAVHTAAAGAVGTEQEEVTVPIVDRASLGEVVDGVLPGAGAWLEATLTPADPRARSRTLLAHVLRASLPIAFVVGAGWPWGLVAVLGWPVAAWIGARDFANRGFVVTGDAVVVREGWWTRSLTVIPIGKLQSFAIVADPLLTRHGLATLVLRSAGAQAVLPATTEADAEALVEALGPRLRPPVPQGASAPSADRSPDGLGSPRGGQAAP